MAVRVVRVLKEAYQERKWKKLIALSVGIVAALFLVVQIVYPWGRTTPLAKVDGVEVGLKTREDIIEILDDEYKTTNVAIRLGDADKVFKYPTLTELGATASAKEVVKSDPYPWYLRIVPTSIFWANAVQTYDPPKVTFSDKTMTYVDEQLMPSCREAPKDATLKPEKGKLVVVPSDPGGKCEKDDVVRTVKALVPSLEDGTHVRIKLTEIPAEVSDKAAKEYAVVLTNRIGMGIKLKADDAIVTVPAEEAMSWMVFETKDGAILPSFSAEKSAGFFAKNVVPKVNRAAGTTRVTTRDFDEISRAEGAPGRELNAAVTLETMKSFITGNSEEIIVATKPIPANVVFTRTYSTSDAGLNALIANFAKDKKGTFGISYAELSGKKRRADYNGDKRFVTASTYKLFVAYSILKRIEAGGLSWEAEGACFNKMISLSDNPCSEDFLMNKVGLQAVTSEAQGIGLKNTTFMVSGGPYTTANDLVVFLGSLQSGQSLNGVSRDRLINAMFGNVYRKGIPAGASGRVADKVGFMNGLLHDAAIVYAPSGPYVLAVMSDGSSWETIAEFTRELEKIRG